MDDQLKQRLLGVTIVVALAVAFVPMLFDEQGARHGDVTGSDVPTPPPDTREHEIALPAIPDEAPPEDQTGAAVATRERAGYRIIPLDDAVAPAPEMQPAGSAGGTTEKTTEDLPVEFGADEGGVPDELPTRDSPLANVPRTAGKPSLSPVDRGDSRTRAPATGGEGRTRAEPGGGAAPRTGGHSAAPTKAAPKAPQSKETTRSPPAARMESVPTEPSKTAVSSPPKATTAPVGPERAASPIKSPEKSVTATKPPQDKVASVRKPLPLSNPKAGSSASAPRQAANDGAAVSKSVKEAETAKTIASSVRKPAETKGNTRQDAGGTPEPPQSQAQIAEVARPAGPKPSTALPGSSPVVAQAAPKKKPDSPAGTAPKAGTVTKPPAPAAQKATPATPSPASANKPKKSGGSSAWVVRAGSFTSEASAKALAEKLRKKNFPAYVQKATAENGSIYRVQVGPASDKSRAEQTRKRLETSAGVSGTLVSHR